MYIKKDDLLETKVKTIKFYLYMFLFLWHNYYSRKINNL